MKIYKRWGLFLLAAVLYLTGCTGGKTESKADSPSDVSKESEDIVREEKIRKALELLSAVQAEEISYVMYRNSSVDVDVQEMVRLLHSLGMEYDTATELKNVGCTEENFADDLLWFAVEREGEKQIFYLGYDPYHAYVSMKIGEEKIFFKNREVHWWVKYGGKTEAESIQDYRKFLTVLKPEDFNATTDPIGMPELDKQSMKDMAEMMHKVAEEMGQQYFIWEEMGDLEYWSKPDLMKQEKCQVFYSGKEGNWKISLTAGRKKPDLVGIWIPGPGGEGCEIFINNQEIYNWVLEKGQRDESKKYKVDQEAYQKYKSEIDAILEKTKQNSQFKSLGCKDAELIYFQKMLRYQKNGQDLEFYHFNIAWVMEDPEQAIQNSIEFGGVHFDEWGRLVNAEVGSFIIQYEEGRPVRTAFLGNDRAVLTEEQMEEPGILKEILEALEKSQD